MTPTRSLARRARRPAVALALLIAAGLALLVSDTGGNGDAVMAFLDSPAAAAPPDPPTGGYSGLLRGDESRTAQWQLRALHAPSAWRQADGDGVVVAVLDSGVDADHTDLADQVLPGLDLVGDTDGRTDPVGHGTAVAGLIAGRGDDHGGVVGLAYGAKILPVRVLDGRNAYEDAGVVARGVVWAVDHGADVINMSLGGDLRDARLAAALHYAFDHDVVVVACTGNLPGVQPGPQAGDDEQSGPVDVWYPAREPGVVAVTGLTDGDLAWPGARTGPATALAAPAANLLGAKAGGGYWRVQGTSFAAPLVAAAAALVRSHWPGMSAANVVNRLVATAHDLGTPGRDAEYGFGEVDPVAAVTAEVPAVDTSPLISD